LLLLLLLLLLVWLQSISVELELCHRLRLLSTSWLLLLLVLLLIAHKLWPWPWPSQPRGAACLDRPSRAWRAEADGDGHCSSSTFRPLVQHLVRMTPELMLMLMLMLMMPASLRIWHCLRVLLLLPELGLDCCTPRIPSTGSRRRGGASAWESLCWGASRAKGLIGRRELSNGTRVEGAAEGLLLLLLMMLIVLLLMLLLKMLLMLLLLLHYLVALWASESSSGVGLHGRASLGVR